jgi:hypothetical protein
MRFEIERLLPIYHQASRKAESASAAPRSKEVKDARYSKKALILEAELRLCQARCQDCRRCVHQIFEGIIALSTEILAAVEGCVRKRRESNGIVVEKAGISGPGTTLGPAREI